MNSTKIQALQGLRALAFLCIFLGHCSIGKFGAPGVTVFLALSGFVLTFVSCKRPDGRVSVPENFRFAISKLKRLYPLHLSMLLFAFALELVVLLHQDGIGAENFLALSGRFVMDSLLLQAWIPDRTWYFSLNGVSWYLSVCLFLYFLFPCVCRIVRTFSLKRCIQCVIGVLLLQCILLVCLSVCPFSNYVKNPLWFAYIFPLFRTGDFVVGCLAGSAFSKREAQAISEHIVFLGEIAGLLLLLTACVISSRELMPDFATTSTIYLPGALLLVFTLAISKGPVSKLLSWKWLVWLGNISGFAFLTHQLIIRCVSLLPIFQSNLPLLVIGSFCLTVISAIAYQRVLKLLIG